MAIDFESKFTKLNTQCKTLIKELNILGIPDPVDHILFTVIILVSIYLPTKLIHSLLDIFYGSSSQPECAVQQQPPKSEQDVGALLSVIKQLETNITALKAKMNESEKAQKTGNDGQLPLDVKQCISQVQNSLIEHER